MAELIDIVKDVSLVLAGALGTFLVSVLFDRWQGNRKTKEVASFVIGDIEMQLAEMEIFERRVIPELKEHASKKEMRESLQGARLFSSFYSETKFIPILSQLPVLPSKCLRLILTYYKVAEFLTNDIKWGIDHLDEGYIVTNWDLSKNVRHAGYTALASLYSEVMEDTHQAKAMRKEAKRFK